MKKRLFFVCLASMIVAMHSCSQCSTSENGADNSAEATFTADAKGVGGIQYGLDAGAVPASEEGLYDTVTPYTETLNFEGEDYTYNRLRFTLGSTTMALATIYDGKLGSIEILAPNVASPEGIGPGTPIATLLEAAPGGWFNQDDSLYCTLVGLTLRVSNALTDSGWQKIHSGAAPEAGDFKEGAVVEAIVYF